MSAKPKVFLERVNMGYWLVDCSVCGTLGVWPIRALALSAKNEHECGGGT